MALIFVTLILSTVIAFLVTSYSKILATLPSLPDFKQKLAHILGRWVIYFFRAMWECLQLLTIFLGAGSADTYKTVWASLSTFFLNYVLPVIRVISNALTNLALHLFHDLRTIIRSIPSTIQTM